MKQEASPNTTDSTLSRTELWFILITAYLSWFFAGSGMAVTTLVMRNAAIGLIRTPELPQPPEALIQQWVSWYTCAFLLGAACGGLLFGWIGDRCGRVRGMGWSVICYSLGAGAGYFVNDPWTLLFVRFVACLGIGGAWPNAVAIVGETWPRRLRPTLAGVLGTGGNLGMVVLALVCVKYHVTPDHWRWVMAVAALPALLGIFVLMAVSESPEWLDRRAAARGRNQGAGPVAMERRSMSVFSREILPRTLLGIALGSIPLLGNWGSVNWLVTWADQV
ncbi:MAG: MFS transporter, partial [Planctomycetota bacterium]|nr:MFS transporter [Planctomycetota bacterium]